ncbi:MAG: hypothetical protein MR698_09395 [Selenomonas sp.]|uniref:hypothetical protein n=1 Tax=uncultured Selenomonas sp. TaxID=159275 RepID=UPI0025E129A4|nr:hypothetical protein [uncultured Selenomonas sp.]MCI6100835.1 hypothetical protein [Selenomonas sp.]
MEGWICICGNHVTGNFCPKCGRPRPKDIQPRENVSVPPSPSSDSMTRPAKKNKAPWIVAGVLLLALAAGGGTYYFMQETSDPAAQTETKAPASQTSSSSSSTEKEAPSESKKEEPQVAKTPSMTELSLAGVNVDDTLEQVHQVLGKESSTQKKDSGLTVYKFLDADVYISNGKVHTIVSNSNQAKTKRGIHQGSSLQDVMNQYGDSYTKQKYNDLMLYEYSLKTDGGTSCILRFAMKGNQVNYISIRKV